MTAGWRVEWALLYGLATDELVQLLLFEVEQAVVARRHRVHELILHVELGDREHWNQARQTHHTKFGLYISHRQRPDFEEELIPNSELGPDLGIIRMCYELGPQVHRPPSKKTHLCSRCTQFAQHGYYQPLSACNNEESKIYLGHAVIIPRSD